MKLKVFDFIEDVSTYLEEITDDLQKASGLIKYNIENLLKNSSGDYLNINARVKSPNSLKEKILRNNYYKIYDDPEKLISNLSDLIGVRIECNFIEDEDKIYHIINKHFNLIDENGLFYNDSNPNLRLILSGKQPQKQKNGFFIYRIDGVYIYNTRHYNFELQIKSLVNVFWGEIEHKIIYKNNNYLLLDTFLRDILGSIKKNLAMIDRQLMLIHKEFNKSEVSNNSEQKVEIEGILSKFIHSAMSKAMYESIGFVVDFKNSCDTIMKYIFRSNAANNVKDYNKMMIATFTRLNEITAEPISFNTNIEFSRDIEFKDEFSQIIGETILQYINKDFQWYIFFRILFEIELGNNAEDFETFIEYLKNRFKDSFQNENLKANFSSEEIATIKNDLLVTIAKQFKRIQDIDFVYDHSIEEIINVLTQIENVLTSPYMNYDNWHGNRDIYLNFFALKILAIYNVNLNVVEILQFIDKVVESDSNIIINEKVMDFINSIRHLSEIDAKSALKLFRFGLFKDRPFDHHIPDNFV
ncbi:MAG: hypothetical protein N4A76_07620 [Firmicutes bacterium]|jgi:ppGpp synthetase/RelA/SpoT-type nucleotidyltranferase|nr:hypothetical protein [Bacillota bacterium]